MPRYFFNLDGDGSSPDEKGYVLLDPKEARGMAVRLVGEVMKDAEGKLWNAAAWRMQVTDEQGATLCTLTISGDRLRPVGLTIRPAEWNGCVARAVDPQWARRAPSLRVEKHRTVRSVPVLRSGPAPCAVWTSAGG